MGLAYDNSKGWFGYFDLEHFEVYAQQVNTGTHLMRLELTIEPKGLCIVYKAFMHVERNVSVRSLHDTIERYMEPFKNYTADEIRKVF